MSDPSPAPQPSPLEMILADKRSIFDTGFPPVVFVVVNALTGLTPAAIAAVALSVLFIVERLIRRRPLLNAVAGLLGTGIAVGIALKSGSASGYFVPKAIQNAVYALVFLGSIAVRRPLSAIIARFAQAHEGGRGSYYELRAVRRAHAEVTAAFGALFALRAVLYVIFIAQGKTGLLATVSLILGYPAFAVVAFASYRLLPKRLDTFGAPPAPSAKAAPEPPL